MPERIVTDARGHRWDVRADQQGRDTIFRHQSGHEVSARLEGPLDEQSTEALLEALDAACTEEGYDPVGQEGVDRTSGEGYETRR